MEKRDVSLKQFLQRVREVFGNHEWVVSGRCLVLTLIEDSQNTRVAEFKK